MKYYDKNKIKLNIRKLFERFEHLQGILSTMNRKNIRHGIFCSGQVEAYTGYRQATDIDILVHNHDIKKFASLFLQDEKEENRCACKCHMRDKNGNEVEIFCASDLKFENKTYNIHLTELAYSETYSVFVDGTKVTFLNPADTIIVKALFKRGVEQDKHDLEDITELVRNYPIDRKYLIKRIIETGTEDEVIPVLKGLGILESRQAKNKSANVYIQSNFS